MDTLIARPTYIRQLLNFKDKELIKIVTGVRRCGKSTLFQLYIDELKLMGVKDKQIQLIKLEEIENAHLLNYASLHEHIMSRVVKDKQNYVFLDEIQLVPDFQKTCRSLFEKGNIDIYLTGSNSKLQSGQWATSIAGRYITINMFPLSFSEFVSSYDVSYHSNLDKLYAEYLEYGSFPYSRYLAKINTPDFKEQIDAYISGIYNTIVLKDVMENRNFSSRDRLDRIINFLISSVGSKISIKNISDTMISDGFKIQPQTVEEYIRALIDAYLLYKADRYDIKGRQLLKTLNKYYFVDLGLRNFLLGKSGEDQGHILENIVYLELLRRGYRVNIGQVKYYNKYTEVDFVARNSDGVSYYQVSNSLKGEETLKRELTPLKNIDDNYPKYILTRDYGNFDYNGIKQVNVLEWLLNKK